MKKIAIIVAGGSGVRMGSEIPKQFLLLSAKPVLWHTVEAFLNSFNDLEVILVLPAQYLDYGKNLLESFSDFKRVQLTSGGTNRFYSVQNGLKLVTSPSIVFVHDGVRCLVNKDLIVRCYEQALEKGSAIPTVGATDSIRILKGGLDESKVADRTTVRLVQTPQTFKSKLLLTAFQQPYQETFTDEATVVEALGERVWLVEGSYDNIKITRPVDLLIAEKLLETSQ